MYTMAPNAIKSIQWLAKRVHLSALQFSACLYTCTCTFVLESRQVGRQAGRQVSMRVYVSILNARMRAF